MSPIYLGLGGNLGNIAETFAAALRHFEARDQLVVERVSSLWRSPAWGFEGPDFLNAVAEIRSETPPQELLSALLAYELQCGRLRGATMGSRPIDLDLLVWGQTIIDEPGLCLPHPATPKRRFVLEPLAELAPQLELPGLGLVGACLSTMRSKDANVWRLRRFDEWLERDRAYGQACHSGGLGASPSPIQTPSQF
jgi:2-amino-4-hydroxy-6-hydroxymethyldihydropteridine diphosphokinase